MISSLFKLGCLILSLLSQTPSRLGTRNKIFIHLCLLQSASINGVHVRRDSISSHVAVHSTLSLLLSRHVIFTKLSSLVPPVRHIAPLPSDAGLKLQVFITVRFDPNRHYWVVLLLCTHEQMAELIEAAAELATSTKYVTAYKYFNTALRNEQSIGIVYLEDDTKMVIYQSKDHITPWHGSWTYEENILKIIFDPNAGKPDLWQHGGISLQSTCALKTGRTGAAQDHLYEGRDYMLREILITPITRWVLRTGSDTWVRIADYSEISHEWIFREALR